MRSNIVTYKIDEDRTENLLAVVPAATVKLDSGILRKCISSELEMSIILRSIR